MFGRNSRRHGSIARIDEDEELRWFFPPADPLNIAAWDQYWMDQINHGFGPGLFDMSCDDRDLVAVMNAEGMKTVLCAGNGISQEPRALADAGFEVVALDLSPKALDIARQGELSAEAFEGFCEPGQRRPGGRVDFVVGDLRDRGLWPGPFDVVIERRTAQLYATIDLPGVMSALAERLSQDGIFLSHCHDGAWRPPAKPRHFTGTWFKANRWTVWRGEPGRKPPGRVAWLVTTTG